jgi:hypothetical protein
MSSVLTICGLVLLLVGTWRGYGAARIALAPFLHGGEPTRTAVEATKPLTERARVLLAVRRTGLATAWLFVALYGLFLLVEAGPA